jgi:Flp pilus assembly protein TadG
MMHKGHTAGASKGFLTRLRHDVRGNTMLLVAGMFLPLVGFVGSGIDLSRAYMAKTRLQSACDAAVLAARKTERGLGYTATSEAVANQYFAANYGTNSFGSYDVDFDSARTSDAKIEGVATAKLDTSVMRVFGKDVFELEVACKAAQSISNSDIMFVLDTTGSMLDTNAGDSQDRFESMKDAVRNFHQTLRDSAPAGVTLRYGFVPFAETVNVGYLLQDEWMVDNWEYQSRRFEGSSVSAVPSGVTENWVKTGPAKETYVFVSNFAATITHYPATPRTESAPARPAYSARSCPLPAGTPASTSNEYNKLLLSTVTSGTKTTEHYETYYSGRTYYAYDNGTNCELGYVDYNDQKYEFDWVTDTKNVTVNEWYYGPVNYDVSSLGGITSGGAISANIGDDPSTPVTIDWKGCIEERSTVRATDYSTIPATAYDMQIDLIPTSDPDTQWRPQLPGLLYSRATWAPYTNTNDEMSFLEKWGNSDYGMCPSPSRKLGAISTIELDDYLDTLVAGGQTYHDIGLVWGARLLSPTGLFSGENAGPQGRNIIFMTDGDIETDIDRYDAYGWSRFDRRRNMDETLEPTNSDTDELVRQRFLALCSAVRGRGMTIWMVAFGTTLTADMETCAGTGKAFQANNADELEDALTQIGGSIAKLRLTD